MTICLSFITETVSQLLVIREWRGEGVLPRGMPMSNPSESGVLSLLGGRRGRLPMWVTERSLQSGRGGGGVCGERASCAELAAGIYI